MRAVSFIALIVGVVLVPSALGLAKIDHDRDVGHLQRALVAETQQHGAALENYFERARSVILLTANSPSFANVLAAPGTRAAKVRRHLESLREVTHQLRYLERLYPASIGEACFIDAAGAEYARVVRGAAAPAGDLSTTEADTPFFAPTFALRFGQTHQTRPYVSPDTKEWVVANATLIPQRDGHKRAIVHFEVTIESFRRAMGRSASAELRVIDAKTGRVIIDGGHRQRVGAALGVRADGRFAGLARRRGQTGTANVAGREVAFRRIERTAGDANDWMVVASALHPAPGVLSGMGSVPLAMLALAVVIMAISGLFMRSARRELEAQATTDSLTELGNRRKLMADLERLVATARNGNPALVALFDLNGFKLYNDTFGHLAGDALLRRLGSALAEAVAPFGGRAYRLGGDEFCVIADGRRRQAVEEAACRALTDGGDGFTVTTAFGSVVVGRDIGDATDVLRRADEAMYAQKHSGRSTAGGQSSAVLLRALAERHPDLGHDLDDVTRLARMLGQRLGIAGEDLAQLEHAAALHDVGKVAIPDGIVNKPGPLTDEEWAFMRRHTVIGERIVSAAPALAAAAKILRSSHERFDGGGYPDGLAGDEIPLGARIIAVCDAFDAMVSARPYADAKTKDEAIAELRRCAGSQFDPAIVAVFTKIAAEQSAPVADAAA